MVRQRFRGDISGIGTTGGTRIVIGHWSASPFGEFTDVMVEFADGHRLLLAPNDTVRDFVTTTYNFDDTVITPVDRVTNSSEVRVRAGDLAVTFTTGRRTFLGWLLALTPTALTTAPWFCWISDPIARVVLKGVRTHGTAGNGRREYYGAFGQRSVISASASWKGEPLGTLTPVEPPVRFGFGSTPAAPSTTSIVTTIDE